MGNIYATYNIQQLPAAKIPNTTLLGPEFRCSDTGICLSEIVSVPFFSDKLLQANLAAQLQLYMKGADDPIQYEGSESDSDDELDELTTPEAVQSRANRLIALLPKVFSKEVAEEFVLHHGDLNETNIMVDHLNHEITGVIDWKSDQTFLDTIFVRNNVPVPETYSKDEQGDGTFITDDSYFAHRHEYEKA
ncbi:hypothetical protein HBH92_041760 [Parastagonospora nodorum]|nr:hypothetical protein HBH50_017800 [Parastagonospora nodorum]KAH4098180.1 hypothetical protein HBH48_029500 [Parastagonospora nodorum]KAH4180679.1 hypothetical protein HBH43_007360 [Parastagonospora nodorum]KAH4419149.1 hypothetical protein HBH92_041760 [Parastagonospora nodorum]KAH4445850.1 hypothetical protein HBH93_058580 [Parastagonospora nodorum]